MLEKSSNNKNVGVIIVTKRAVGAMLGSMKNHPCRIWIQKTRRGGTGGGGGGRRQVKEGRNE